MRKWWWDAAKVSLRKPDHIFSIPTSKFNWVGRGEVIAASKFQALQAVLREHPEMAHTRISFTPCTRTIN